MSNDKNGDKLDHAELVRMFDLAEAIEDLIPEHEDFGVVLMALMRVVAKGGMQLRIEDVMTKREYVAEIVSCFEQHYEQLCKEFMEGGRDE